MASFSLRRRYCGHQEHGASPRTRVDDRRCREEPPGRLAQRQRGRGSERYVISTGMANVWTSCLFPNPFHPLGT